MKLITKMLAARNTSGSQSRRNPHSGAFAYCERRKFSFLAAPYYVG